MEKTNNLQGDNKTWVLTTKKPGDRIANWVIDHLYENTTRHLLKSERCKVTSFCYPPGAKMMEAELHKAPD
ncbi:MAG: hypothetical protein ACI89U_000704 [Gammaproteobacteria bacterium]|jgi:hypothetical protein